MRTERAHLQHEVDILNQKLTQESMVLKDELKGMFNDRKMAVRMEQRGMESAIQELNYKITVALNSDSKGEVEGLRWVLTRRAAMAIGGMACTHQTSFILFKKTLQRILTPICGSPHTLLLTLLNLHDTPPSRGTKAHGHRYRDWYIQWK